MFVSDSKLTIHLTRRLSVKTFKKSAVAVLATAAMIALSACSSSDGGAVDPEVPPVKIMVFGSFSQPPFPLAQIKTAAEAAVARVNADGGINGAQIELIACDDQMNPNDAAACGRQAVDENVAAVVGGFTLFGDAIMPLIEAANIPYIMPVAISPMENNSADSFPIMSSATPAGAAMLSLEQQGCKNVVFAAPDNAQSQYAFDTFAKPVADNLGITTNAVLYAADTTDYTSVAARVADAGNCVVYGGGPQDSSALFLALSQTGGKFINMALSTIAFPEAVLPQLGDAGDGIQVMSTFFYPSTGNATTEQLVSDIQAIDPKTSIDETAFNAYAAVLTFAQAAAMVEGEITGKAVAAVLSTEGNVIDTGIYAKTDFATAAGFFPPAPRVAGSVFQPYVSKGGIYVENGKPLDLQGNLGF